MQLRAAWQNNPAQQHHQGQWQHFESSLIICLLLQLLTFITSPSLRHSVHVSLARYVKIARFKEKKLHTSTGFLSPRSWSTSGSAVDTTRFLNDAQHRLFYMLKYTQNEEVQCFTSPSSPPHHLLLLFCHLLCGEFRKNQSVRRWRAGAVMVGPLQGPCSTWLGSHLCWEYAQLWEICLSEVH